MQENPEILKSFQQAKLGLSACAVWSRKWEKNLSSAKYFANEFARLSEPLDILQRQLLESDTPYFTGKYLSTAAFFQCRFFQYHHLN